MRSIATYGSVEKDTSREDEDERTIDEIVTGNTLVWRFCAYGALKNLKFFEAFLMVILIDWGLSLYQIGLLSSVIYGTAYLSEVPAGVIADHCGLKNVLLLSFSCYVVSFVFYAAGASSTYGMTSLVAASVSYGLGEATRSGTHKAMILRWLDKQGMSEHKAFVYSRTRSFSNLGSAANAIGSVVLVLILKNRYAMFFLISAIPYALDFLMVCTYPSYMNDTPLNRRNLREIIVDTKEALSSLLRRGRSRRTVLSTSSFMAVFLTLKHYIQPVIRLYGDAVLHRWNVFGHLDESERTNVLLGLLYAVFYAVSAVATRNSWRLKSYVASPKQAMDLIYEFYLILLLFVGLVLYWCQDSDRGGLVVIIVSCYLVMFVLQNLWKPWGVAGVSDLLGKDRRALVLSSDSLLKTIIQFALAPGVGYVSDAYGLDVAFVSCGVFFLLAHHAFMFGDWYDEQNDDEAAAGSERTETKREISSRETRGQSDVAVNETRPLLVLSHNSEDDITEIMQREINQYPSPLRKVFSKSAF